MILQHPVDKPAMATLVLAHGAGAGMQSAYMQTLAGQLVEQGFSVLRFEFPYMIRRHQSGRKTLPDPMPRLQQAFTQVLQEVSGPVLIGGKSMGGRVASMLLDDSTALGALAFGYPFHPPAKPDKLRIAHLQALDKPLLVVQGCRDPFGRPPEVSAYPLGPAVQLHWIEAGDHDLCPTKSSGRTQLQLIAEAAQAAGDFARRLLA